MQLLVAGGAGPGLVRTGGGMWLVLAFCLAAAFDPARATGREDVFEPMTPPPAPKSDTAMVYLGESIEIPLRVGGRVEEPLRILIRTWPRNGSLGEVRLLPGGRGGVVRYTPHPGAAPGGDSFQFAGQSWDSAVSSPARVDIALRVRPACLEYVRDVDFGRVAVGGEAVREVVVSNTGGGAVLLQPKGSDPWFFEDASPVRLAGGADRALRLRFRPRSAGDFASRLDLSAGGKEFLVARGSSFLPLQWDPEGLVFPAGKRPARHASVGLRNASPEDRALDFDWPGFLSGPQAVSIPAGGEVALDVELLAPPDFSYSGHVPFRSGGGEWALPLRVDPAPANVVAEPGGDLDLGVADPGGAARGKLSIRNDGGQPARILLDVPRGVALEPAPTTFVLEPGGTREFLVSASPAGSGAYRSELRVDWGGAEPIAVPLRFAAAPPGVPAKPPPATAPLPPKAPAANFSGVPEVESVSVLESTPSTVVLQWKVPSAQARGFFIERREVMRAEVGAPGVVWKRWDRVGIQVEGDTATARFRKLAAGTFWVIRIRAVGANGLASAPPSRAFRIETQPPPPLFPVWFWWSAGAAALALLGILWRKNLQARAAGLDARIKNLGAA